ncbi:MSH2 [Hepatospora eriocheir]|uniref:MSH2 n=2 Tax=Hepatospora eriocheir TaxID=1081669 RepID=A0A1X0QJH7_9MICR|nr:MSH2 [Hepatospora eriocheir]
MKSYQDLDREVFKYFRRNELNYIYKEDIKYLPIEYHKNNEVKLEKIEPFIREILVTKKIPVHEYTEDKEGNVIINKVVFKLTKTGMPSNYNDFLDICISNEITPTLCSVEIIDKKVKFRLLIDSKIRETDYFDDDLYSLTYSLVSLNNCILILHKDTNLSRIFNSWGIQSLVIKNNKELGVIENYMKLNFEVEKFECEDRCIVNIDDFDLVDFGMQTQQGKRLFNQWLRAPLINKEEIERRLNICEYFTGVNLDLNIIVDIKKIITRIQTKKISLTEIIRLYQCINLIPKIIEKLKCSPNKQFSQLHFKNHANLIEEEFLIPLNNVYGLLHKVLEIIERDIDIKNEEVKENVSGRIVNLNIVKQNINNLVDEELNRVKVIFPKAKIFNNQFKTTSYEFKNNKGFEIIKMSKTGVTFTTKVMNDLKIQKEVNQLDIDSEVALVLTNIKNILIENIPNLEIFNYLVSLIDIFSALSVKVLSSYYCRPKFVEKEYLIEGGWHPMIQSDVVKNDINFEDKKVCIITGPNMGGKSTFIKTLSLISLYAQVGSYVPAISASLPIFHRIIMRIGANDSLSKKISTFMVEMIELNKILRNNRFSLVCIDELGRGTSVIDGLSLCMAVKEHLCNINSYSVITTHFSELNDNKKVILNKKILIKDGLITYKLVDGVSDNSFGIEVAKMVKFPQEVIDNAIDYMK